MGPLIAYTGISDLVKSFQYPCFTTRGPGYFLLIQVGANLYFTIHILNMRFIMQDSTAVEWLALQPHSYIKCS